jgi:NAD+ kinase
MKRVGILYHPKRDNAIAFSLELERFLKTQSVQSWRCSAWSPEKARPKIDGTDLLLSVGGDGTILRSSRIAIPECIPILGINLGKLGFLTELRVHEAMEKLPLLLQGEGWIEKRTVLEASIDSNEAGLYALNDVFIGRRSSARLVSINCRLNGEPLTIYRADGVIVATASGSTGYAMAAGGPVLHPQSRDMVLEPVASHFTFEKTLILPPETEIAMTVSTTHDAMISIDGQLEHALKDGSTVTVKLSPHIANFLRLQPKDYFYRTLESRLKRNIE